LVRTTLAQYSGTVIAVTHDRYFLDNVAGWILELDREGSSLEGIILRLDQNQAGCMKEKVASKRHKNLERELDCSSRDKVVKRNKKHVCKTMISY
jgi:ATPase subunit of ABC transporter with duplicated ATPase domains